MKAFVSRGFYLTFWFDVAEVSEYRGDTAVVEIRKPGQEEKIQVRRMDSWEAMMSGVVWMVLLAVVSYFYLIPLAFSFDVRGLAFFVLGVGAFITPFFVPLFVFASVIISLLAVAGGILYDMDIIAQYFAGVACGYAVLFSYLLSERGYVEVGNKSIGRAVVIWK